MQENEFILLNVTYENIRISYTFMVRWGKCKVDAWKTDV